MSSLKYKSRVRYDRNYHFKSFFNGNTGFYVRSGVIGYKGEDTGIDPFMSSFPELIDVGIMERCICASKCKVDCYQQACDRTGENMSVDNFKRIVEECSASGATMQFALGGAGDPDTHDHFEEILRICYDNNIVPNFTTSGIALTEEKAKLCKKYCGAVAVSDHNAEYTKKAVELLIKNGVKTNIHYVLSKKTIERAIDILNGGAYYDNINAIVFLLYKPVGLGKIENVLSPSNQEVQAFFKSVDNRKVKFKIGFDSCSCNGLINFSNNYNKNTIDYCEGGRFSMYISADMYAMPCSFANQDSSWWYKLDEEHGIADAWNSQIFDKFRERLKYSCKGCKDRENCGGGCPLLDTISLCHRAEKQVYR